MISKSHKFSGKHDRHIEFLDLFPLQEIQSLQDEFARATGVASIITTPEGVPITRPSNFCRLCNEIIRNTAKGLENCYKSDALIGRPSDNGPTIQRCMSGGLWDAGAGITIEGQHVANWLIGQVRDSSQTDEQMAAYAREIGADEKEVLEAFREVPAMSKEQFANVSSMLYSIANQLSRIAYQNIKQSILIDQLQQTEVELRQKQADLLASEQRLEVVIDNLPSAMIYQVEMTADGRRSFTYVSDNVRQLHQISAEEVLNDPLSLYGQIHPDDAPALELAEDKAITGMKTFKAESRFILPDGSVRWCLLSSSPRTSVDGSIIWDGIEIDITERKNAEEEQARLESLLRQSQKIEAIGQLAGGVAHDLNNMLSPIIGFSELLLLKSIDFTQDNKKSIENILEAGKKARDLVQQLLAFSRKQTLRFDYVNLNDSIDKFENLLRRTIREDIEFVTSKSASLSLAQADLTQVEQVLMNLVVNAQDSMPQGGSLYLGTEDVDIELMEDDFVIDVKPGKYVRLVVRDTGVGMSDEVREQVFEPFYSTKGDKGTGLGLATVYGIITQHGGTISVRSEIGKGTEISIYLPAADSTSLEYERKKSGDFGADDGDETILLVEDDKKVLEMTEAILKYKGYTVLTAGTGDAALEVLRSCDQSVALLLTDVVMPGVNGKELFIRAQEVQPDLKVLFMSGYNDDVISHRGILEEGINYIQKPFTLSALCVLIREILNN